MNVDIRDQRFRSVAGDDIELEEMGTGFDFTEGPIWNHVEKHLIFSDMPGNIMRKWKQDGSIETWRQPSHMTNGNAYDREGRLVTCEHATSRVTRTEPHGAADGMKLDSAGNLYTTGPSGVQVFDADTTCLGVIYIPQHVSNFCWGEDDMRSLFITASNALYRVRVRVPGNKAF